MQTDYVKQAEEFLTRHNLEFRSVLVGNDCPMFCEDALKEKDMDKINVYPRKSHIHGKHYRCTISGKDRGHLTIDFWNSYADEEYNALGTRAHRMGETMLKYDRGGSRKVKAYDVLACIQKDEPGTFEDFCSSFGYDSDSRRAETIYHAVQKEYRKTQRFFTAEELAELQEIQ
jgi:hypothetical protein